MTDETRAPLPELGTNNAAGQSEGTQDAGLPDAGRQEQADAALSPGRPAGPAAPTGDTPRPARPVMSEGNLSGWSVYVTSLERYTDQLEQLYGAACLQLQARGDKTVALSATRTIPSVAIRAIKSLPGGRFVIEYGDGNKTEFHTFRDMADYIAEGDQARWAAIDRADAVSTTQHTITQEALDRYDALLVTGERHGNLTIPLFHCIPNGDKWAGVAVQLDERNRFINAIAAKLGCKPDDSILDKLDSALSTRQSTTSRPATLCEAIALLKARLSDHLSPAEQRDLDSAITEIGGSDFDDAARFRYLRDHWEDFTGITWREPSRHLADAVDKARSATGTPSK